MHRIQYSAKVLKELNELDSKTYLRVREKIISLEAKPRPGGSLKLTNEEGFRVRQVVWNIHIMQPLLYIENLCYTDVIFPILH